MKRLIASALVGLAALTAAACWYQKANYNDYIAVVNNMVRHAIQVEETSGASGKIQLIEYKIGNLHRVDFPVTVTMKLTSEQPIIIQDIYLLSVGVLVPTSRLSKIEARLEYRVLPHGNWVKVSEYSIETGRLPDEYPPSPYLGRNNIHPKGLKAGDKIMVRLYVTDGLWQSGDPNSKCDALATAPEYTYRYEFPYYDYIVKNVVEDVTGESDLGGGWLPHYVAVLEYSGNTRPIN